MKLAKRSCHSCQGTAEKVPTADRKTLLTEIPEWSILVEGGIEHLSRTFRFSDYRRAVDFTSKVAELAEAENHHPRLILEWGQVTVDWWTHTLGGLHLNDFILAARCDGRYETGDV